MKLKTMDIQKFLFTGWCPKMAHNVPHIPEGGDFGTQNFQLTMNNLRSTDFHFSTKTPLLGICCYSQ